MGLIYLTMVMVNLVVAQDLPSPSPSPSPFSEILHHHHHNSIPQDFKIPRILKAPKITMFWVGYCTMQCELMCGKLRTVSSYVYLACFTPCLPIKCGRNFPHSVDNKHAFQTNHRCTLGCARSTSTKFKNGIHHFPFFLFSFFLLLLIFCFLGNIPSSPYWFACINACLCMDIIYIQFAVFFLQKS